MLDAYIDDVVVVIVAHDQKIAQILLSRVVMRTVFQWMEGYRLQLAGEKTNHIQLWQIIKSTVMCQIIYIGVMIGK